MTPALQQEAGNLLHPFGTEPSFGRRPGRKGSKKKSGAGGAAETSSPGRFHSKGSLAAEKPAGFHLLASPFLLLSKGSGAALPTPPRPGPPTPPRPGPPLPWGCLSLLSLLPAPVTLTLSPCPSVPPVPPACTFSESWAIHCSSINSFSRHILSTCWMPDPGGQLLKGNVHQCGREVYFLGCGC